MSLTVKGVGVLHTCDGVLVKGAPPGLEDRESGIGCETMEDTTGEGVSGANTDVSSVVEVSVLSREEFCRGLYTSDGFIFLMAMASGLYGKMPDFENPALIFDIENAFSKGSLTTEANLRLDTTKFFLAKERARTDLKKVVLQGLKNGNIQWLESVN